MTPSVSPYATGPVPALAGNDWNSVQYQLRTGPRNSMASSSTIYISSQERKCQYLKHRQFGRGEERGDDGGTGGREDGTFLEPKKVPKKAAYDVKVNWMKAGSGPGHLPPRPPPVAGKIRVPGSAQAPSVPLNISPSVVLRTPCADLRSACHGGVVGCGEQNWLTAVVGKIGHLIIANRYAWQMYSINAPAARRF